MAADFIVYRHNSCGGDTTVAGEDLRKLATPFFSASLTECAECGKTDPVDRFTWVHSGETITQARDRIHEGMPAMVQFLSHPILTFLALLGPIAGGAALGMLVNKRLGIGFMVFGFFGFSAILIVLTDFLARKVYGIRYEDLL